MSLLEYWITTEPRKSLVCNRMSPNLRLIENNSSAHCCLKGGRLLSIPNCSCKDGEAGGNRANSDCNLWPAGNRQSAGADASAGACPDRASGRTPRPIFHARWRRICTRPRQWEPRDSSPRYGRGFDDIQFEGGSDAGDGFKNHDQHGERQCGGLPPARWIHAGRIDRAGGALCVSSKRNRRGFQVRGCGRRGGA